MKIKLTKNRQLILATLQNSTEALSAKEINHLLPTVDLATIYRALDLFTKEQLITVLHFDSSEAKYEYQHEPHHHAVCTKCTKVLHFDAKDDAVKKILTLNNFKIDQVEITVRGTCTNGHTK